MYKVVGADGREYGPVTREAILEWIAQGRANAQTIARFEDGAWRPLATFDDFKNAFAVTTPPGATTTETPLIQTTYVAPDAPAFSGIGSQRSTNVPAVLGIIFPIVCCCCVYVGPILGIIFSLIGLSQIRANPNKYSTGDSLPKVGLGLSIAVLLLHIVAQVLDSGLSKLIQKTGAFNF